MCHSPVMMMSPLMATNPLKGAQDVRSPSTCLSPRLKLEVSLKDLFIGGTTGGQHAVVELSSSSKTLKTAGSTKSGFAGTYSQRTP